MNKEKKRTWLDDISLNETYVLVLFPDVQKYMEEEWFDNVAVLCSVDDPKHFLAGEYSAFFIPIKYVNQNNDESV
tara:strand:+ start:11678 stop:11902 length:225 start_codon:yes stop_codon:yes gene_type:complete